MSSKEKLKCRKVPYVMQFYVSNRDMCHEEYTHHILFTYYPFRDENKLKSGNPPTYADRLKEPCVTDVISDNCVVVESYA